MAAFSAVDLKHHENDKKMLFSVMLWRYKLTDRLANSELSLPKAMPKEE